MKNAMHIKNVEDFNVSFSYDKKKDKLDLNSSRDLKNVDLLLILIQILSMVEEEYRELMLEVALRAILLKKQEDSH